ncbi:MAG: YjjG family noncanonical pyrimidine nucleotidase [Bacteroidales bacterium]|nr:YjjG family noncanonical pyrimidine nucleotidase [Bacteroidales bacterium]
MCEQKKYSDLFIDFDDTLYDTHGNAVIALAELFEYFGWEAHFPDPELFYKAYWETNVTLWGQYAKGKIERQYLIIERFRRPLSLGLGTMDLSDENILRISDKFLDLCAVKPGVVPDAHELVQYLRKKGYRLHICSNGFHEVQYRKLRSCGLLDAFDTIILSEDAGANKPSPQFFAHAFERTHASVQTTLMIGDNFTTDIHGAQSVGLDVIYFNRHPENGPAPEPVNYEVHSLKEVMQIL